MKAEAITISPVVKWAGGKRQLLERIEERLPPQFKNYYEPFVGGGAVLFGLQPKTATVNDINKIASKITDAVIFFCNMPITITYTKHQILLLLTMSFR